MMPVEKAIEWLERIGKWLTRAAKGSPKFKPVLEEFVMAITAIGTTINAIVARCETAEANELTLIAQLGAANAKIAALQSQIPSPEDQAAVSAGQAFLGTTAPTLPATVGPAAQLAFTTQPPATIAVGATLAPVVVTVQDANGNTVATDTSTITLAASAGTLGGTLSQVAVNGVATFADLTVTPAGSYTLSATDGVLTAATSTAVVAS